MTKSFFMWYNITVLMNFGRGLPGKSYQERVVVGTLVAQPFEPTRLHVALVENVVDAEPEPVGVVGDTGPQTQFVVGVAESHAAEPAHGIGEGRVVEVAAHDYVAGELFDFLGREVGLFVAGPGRIDKFGEQMLLHLVEVVGIGVCGNLVVELLVGLSKPDRLHVLVDDGNLALAYLYPIGRYGTRFGVDGVEEQSGRIFREEVHAVARGYPVGIACVDAVDLRLRNLQAGVGVGQFGRLLQAHQVGILCQQERDGAVLGGIAPLVVEQEIDVIGHQSEPRGAVVGRLGLVYGAVAGYASPGQYQGRHGYPDIARVIGEPYEEKGHAHEEVEGKEQLEQNAHAGGTVGRVGSHDEE